MSAVQAIPASYTAQVSPGVISAGGTALDLLGMALSASTRVPIGSVFSFATASAVSSFFGPGTPEANFASVYFAANDNKPKTPNALLFTQYPTAAVNAYLRGGNISGLTLAQLQALSGTIIVTVSGQTFTSSTINLGTASSFSAAAALIQTGIAGNDASFTGAITAGTASFTGSVTLTTLTVTVLASGSLFPGQTLAGGTMAGGTTIVKQLTGTAGNTGTYQVSISQTVTSGALTATSTSGILTVSAVASGALALGQVVAGSTTLANTVITQLLTGAGAAGIYVVSLAQAVTSAALTSGATTVTYDSQSGAFIITGGTPGATGTITFATGTLSTSLLLTQATGAVTSQGSAIATPVAFMTAVAALTQNWATFTTVGFEPVTADCVSFAGWCSSQNNRYAYMMWDTDVTVTAANPTSSAGYLIQQANDSGTVLIYEAAANLNLTEAMVMGAAASIDFTQTNGRRNFKFLTQSGLLPGINTQTIAAQLTTNGYNYYGANANATGLWNFFAEGSITGPFAWADSYFNQIWLNSQCQSALMNLLTTVGSVPFNTAGAGLINAALADPINAALNFGAIRQNVPLSALQIAEVNAAAGVAIDGILSTRGWYLQVTVPSAAVRAARGPWPITLWYMDGGSVNRINLSSVLVQ